MSMHPLYPQISRFHRHFLPLCRCALLVLALLLPASCITEDVESDTPEGCFRACWKYLDEHYCFFREKGEAYGLNWDSVYAAYGRRVSSTMTDEQLFEVLAEMSYELRDGHVNIYAKHDVSRYGAWFDDFPANYSDSLERITLGKSGDYMQTSSLKYKVLDDNIGYVRCSTFESLFGDGNLSEMMRQLSYCDGLIIDVRSNGGGMLTAAQKLASLFINEKTTLGYMCHKTGTAHDAFSTPEAVKVSPFEGLRWQKPVCILTNRRTYSAANAFVSYVKGLDGVTVIGDKTGGGAGMPFSGELPNGWSIRFSACPTYDRFMTLTEFGIDPDIRVDITSSDYRSGTDIILETARRTLRTAKQTRRNGR